LTTLRDVDRGAGLANHPDRCQPEEHCVGHDVREEGDRGQRGDRQQPVAAELWHARLCEGRARAGGLPDRQHGHAPDVVVQVHAVLQRQGACQWQNPTDYNIAGYKVRSSWLIEVSSSEFHVEYRMHEIM
jgi:hypothetical protein